MNLALAKTIFLKRTFGFTGFWCVAGGWAIDIFLGRQTRRHDDLEIIVLRGDDALLFEQFQQFNPRKIISGESPTFVSWTGGPIEPEVIQIRLDPTENSEFELLLTPAEANHWICRRNEDVTRPLNDVFLRSNDGVPFLVPEIVLLFKAKYLREKDERDFENVFGFLDDKANSWLRNSLLKIHPGHRWIDRLPQAK